MSFILSAQRSKDAAGAFERYRTYLESVRQSMPESVYAMASSDWYYSPGEHRCPHDAWLVSATISDTSKGEGLHSTSMRIRLLGAYDDGFIEFHYPSVVRYSFDASDTADGHRDWRYDEFRVSERGHVIHEIEWCGPHDTARWVIESTDVHFQWHPNENGAPQ